MNEREPSTARPPSGPDPGENVSFGFGIPTFGMAENVGGSCLAIPSRDTR
ncbi:hypothetical protein [Streptomyces sp. NPDC087300]